MVSTPTLAQHALRYRFNGVPLRGEPDDDGATPVVGVVDEPVWTLDGMTDAQQRDLGAAFFALLAERDRLGRSHSDARVYAIALEEHGVACPHPPHWRAPIGDGRRPGFACAACNVWVVPA